MNIAHIINSIDKSTGGPARSVTHLIECCSCLLEKNDTINLHTGLTNEPIIRQFKHENAKLYFYNYNLIGGLSNIDFNQPDIFHGHGLWQQPVHQMAKIARRNKIPYIITPRGMLEPWSLQQRKLKKKIAMHLFQYKDLKRAACIHATAEMEVESIMKLGFKNPIAMIPNGIDVAEFPLKKYNKITASRKKIFFLSRIHPKKGLELLIEAWGAIDFAKRENWSIDIAGNGELEYINQLKKLIKDKSLDNQIRISGPKFGKEKLEMYQAANLFVLPTYSENFGIVVAEALSCGVPVITTKGAPWEVLNTFNAGWWIDIGVAPLIQALNEALVLSEKERVKMGKNGRTLVEEKYSIQAVAQQMKELYSWVLNGGEQPKFVY